MCLDRIINLLNNSSSPICTALRKTSELSGIEPQTDHGVPATTLGFSHEPSDSIVPCGIQLIQMLVMHVPLSLFGLAR